MERSMKRRSEPGPQGKGGRKPKRTILTFHRLVAEVEAEVDELMKKTPKLKKPPIRQAIANCLRHGAEIQPHSWWWKNDVPLGLESAKALFYEAKAAVKNQGPVEPSKYKSLFRTRKNIQAIGANKTVANSGGGARADGDL